MACVPPAPLPLDPNRMIQINTVKKPITEEIFAACPVPRFQYSSHTNDGMNTAQLAAAPSMKISAIFAYRMKANTAAPTMTHSVTTFEIFNTVTSLLQYLSLPIYAANTPQLRPNILCTPSIS